MSWYPFPDSTDHLCQVIRRQHVLGFDGPFSRLILLMAHNHLRERVNEALPADHVAKMTSTVRVWLQNVIEADGMYVREGCSDVKEGTASLSPNRMIRATCGLNYWSQRPRSFHHRV